MGMILGYSMQMCSGLTNPGSWMTPSPKNQALEGWVLHSREYSAPGRRRCAPGGSLLGSRGKPTLAGWKCEREKHW